MKKKKLFAFLVVASLVVSSFVSCSNQNENKNEKENHSNIKVEALNTSSPTEIKNYTINEEKISEIDDCSVGDCILLGKYEQNNDLSDGSEEIKWIVLEKQEDKMLVISKYGLDCQPYQDERVSATWDTCSLKEWLNSVFFYVAFSESEAEMIAQTLISEEDELEYDTQTEEEKENKLFLLSVEEMNDYLGDNCMCLPTEYALSKGVYISENVTVNGDKTCCWWLRTSADNKAGDTNAFVFNDELLHDIGAYVSNIAVRPAMWIELES